MSEELLKALMQLFALASDVDDYSKDSRQVVESFLKSELSDELVTPYLNLYDSYISEFHQELQQEEGVSQVADVLQTSRYRKTISEINNELTQRQKFVVLIRLLEYILADGSISDHEIDFLRQLSTEFNISEAEFNHCLKFMESEAEVMPDVPNILIVNAQKNSYRKYSKHKQHQNLQGDVVVLRIPREDMFVMRYFGSRGLTLNGQIIRKERPYIMRPGSSIRGTRIRPVYYSDILSRFFDEEDQTRVVFKADNISYKFKGGNFGLHPLSFQEESGRLIGIMGGSGAGKSTLLNVLNGNNAPNTGSVSINSIDIHQDIQKLEGVIGYISQDDLLIEELTVYQNLYYNAKLCFDNLDNETIDKKVLELLTSLGLFETRDLKVGSPLDKTISGGQRKRLNIALELIREPSVLFVDEPTSGLSSRDSENIMDLLKQLSLKGKLVFVVIHQPSSQIFKLFDKLLLLDKGGYAIYYGDPVDSVMYFKSLANYVNSNESECSSCGNVNVEQIFNIVEARVIDEYGQTTEQRKFSPRHWYNKYKKNTRNGLDTKSEDKLPPPKSDLKVPNVLKQFSVFMKRDVLSKLTDKEYLLINFLEAPVLALILTFFIKYSPQDASNELGYTLFQNSNLPAYLFMGVIVSLFLGLTVSAEEIIKDRKIRKRESFLKLSKLSYLNAKVLVMFAISAIQTLTFVLIGNSILEIKGMNFDHWLILFSTACFANMLGLNISATFKSAITIYIIIPLLIIPQLLFSGVIVSFDKLNPSISSHENVPVIGEIMASKWAFEALAVHQFKGNEYEKHFYDHDKKLSQYNFMKTYWLPELEAKAESLRRALNNNDKDEIKNDLKLIRKELNEAALHYNIPAFTLKDKLGTEDLNKATLEVFTDYLESLRKFFNKQYFREMGEKDEVIMKLQSDSVDLNLLKQLHHNEALAAMVQNKASVDKIQEWNNELIQVADPIYKDPQKPRAHFYAPQKLFGGSYTNTFKYNIIVIWSMALLLLISLYTDLLARLLKSLSFLEFLIPSKLKRKKI